jgi:hypothetical protein
MATEDDCVAAHFKRATTANIPSYKNRRREAREAKETRGAREAREEGVPFSPVEHCSGS